MTSNHLKFLVTALAALTSCASTQPANSKASYSYSGTEKPSALSAPAALSNSRPTNWSDNPYVTLEVFHQDIELEELEYDPDNGSNFDIFDTDRERTGFRASFGRTEARGYFQVFGEDFGSGATPFENFGVGGGINGIPTAHHFGNQFRLIVPYRAGFNAAWGDEDTGVSQDVFYAEFEGEVGVGFYIHGIQPSVGVYASSVVGAIEVNDGNPGTDLTFAGTNSGGFMQIMYKHDNFPVWGKMRVMGGDVKGIVLAAGVTF